MTQSIIFAASLLSADFAHLGDESRAVLQAGADVIHLDVMDHHFVPNLTFGATVCDALRRDKITAEIDVHLMVTDPEKYIAPFAKAGANRLTFHPETVADVKITCQKIHDAGMQAGLAFNPDKPVVIADDVFSEVEMILIMSVFAGFGGQTFIADSVNKIRETKKLIRQKNPRILLGVDGGVNVNTIRDVVNAGANFLVMGSAIFGANDYHERILELKSAIGCRKI